jgi:tape measure domain-containing protein
LGLDIATLGLRIDANGFLRTTESADRALKGLGSSASGAERMLRGVQRVMAAIGAALGIHQLISYADQWKTLESRIRLVTRSTNELISVQDRLFQVAQRTRTEYGATVELYSRVARQSKELGKSTEDMIRFTEITQKAIQVGGSGAQEAASGVRQLGQALGAGVLRGDEFVSMMENMSGVAQILAQALGVSMGELRKMALEGKLTSTLVVDAILKMEDKVNQDFAKIPMTMGQAFTVMRNEILKFVGQTDSALKASDKFAHFLVAVSKNLRDLVAALVAAAAAYVAFRVNAERAAIAQFVGPIISAVRAQWQFVAATYAASGAAGAFSVTLTSLRAVLMSIPWVAVISILASAAIAFFGVKAAIKDTSAETVDAANKVEALRASIAALGDQDLANEIARVKKEMAELAAAAAAGHMVTTFGTRTEMRREGGVLTPTTVDVAQETKMPGLSDEDQSKLRELINLLGMLTEAQDKNSEAVKKRSSDAWKELETALNGAYGKSALTLELLRIKYDILDRKRENATKLQKTELDQANAYLDAIQKQLEIAAKNEHKEREIELLIEATEFSDLRTMALERLTARAAELTEQLKAENLQWEEQLALKKELARVEEVLQSNRILPLDSRNDGAQPTIQRTSTPIIDAFNGRGIPEMPSWLDALVGNVKLAKAQKASDEMKQIWEEAARGVQRSFADAFIEISTNGLTSFREFGKSLVDLFRDVAAQIVAAMLAQKLGIDDMMANIKAGKATTGQKIGAAGIVGGMAGYQSGSVLGGALSGGLAGFATGNPIAGIVGVVGGVIGGLLGQAKRAKELAEAMRKAAAEIASAIDEWIATLNGDEFSQWFIKLREKVIDMLMKLDDSVGVNNFTDRTAPGLSNYDNPNEFLDYLKSLQALQPPGSEAWERLAELIFIVTKETEAYNDALVKSAEVKERERIQKGADFGNDLLIREAKRRGTVEGIQVEGEINIARQIEQAQELYRSGAISWDMVERLAVALREDLADAIAAAVEAIEQAKKALMDDLTLAEFAQSGDQQAIDIFKANERADEWRKQAKELGMGQEVFDRIDAWLQKEIERIKAAKQTASDISVASGGGESTMAESEAETVRSFQNVSEATTLRLVDIQRTALDFLSYLPDIAAGVNGGGSNRPQGDNNFAVARGGRTVIVNFNGPVNDLNPRQLAREIGRYIAEDVEDESRLAGGAAV